MERQYTFTLVVREGSHEFWEDLVETNKTGCEEVTELVRTALAECFHFAEDKEVANAWLTLKRYEDLNAD